MSFKLSVPRNDETNLDLQIAPGETFVLLGANGTGKSSLMHRFYNANSSKARRITAHRQTWLGTNAITLSPGERQQYGNSIRSSDSNPHSRWKDDFAAYRTSIAIYDLIDSENVRARKITEAVDHDNFDLARELRKQDAPIKIINELLRESNIPVTIAIRENDQIVASKNKGPAYSIAELSDGERNALLIAANVLTAADGTLLLIDEP